ANVFACALFAAMAGSSPATCSAIGSAGIPEMRKRGYSGGFASGIIAAGGTPGLLLPPPLTLILFAGAAPPSLPRVFPSAPRRPRPRPAAGGVVRGLFRLALPPRIPARAEALRRDGCALGNSAAGRAFDAGQVRAAPAGAAVRDPADRRDGRALWRLCHAVGD